jgi:hypothetical protein
VIVSPENDAVTPESTLNTRLVWLALIVTPAAGPLMCTIPLLSSSWPLLRVIVCGVLKFVSPETFWALNTIVSKVATGFKAVGGVHVGVRVGDRGAQRAGARVVRVRHDVGLRSSRQQRALLQNHQAGPQPPLFPLPQPLLGLDRSPSASSLIVFSG